MCESYTNSQRSFSLNAASSSAQLLTQRTSHATHLITQRTSPRNAPPHTNAPPSSTYHLTQRDMDHQLIASTWFTSFASALASSDVRAVTNCFLPEGWLRDLLVFSWDNRSLSGQERIASYLTDLLSSADITDLALDTNAGHFAPQGCYIPQLQASGVELTFKFDCSHGHGRGHVRLLPDERGSYKAFTVMTELDSIRGHEELGSLPSCDDDSGCPGPDAQDKYRRRVQEVETRPYVLIGMPLDAVTLYLLISFSISRRRANRSSGCRQAPADEYSDAYYREAPQGWRRLAQALPFAFPSHSQSAPQQ